MQALEERKEPQQWKQTCSANRQEGAVQSRDRSAAVVEARWESFSSVVVAVAAALSDGNQ